MGDFNANLLNIGNKFEISEFNDALSSHFVASYIFQPTRIVRNSKTLMDNIFLDSIELSSYSGNVTSKISDQLLQFLMLRDFHQKSPLQFNEIFARSHNVFNNDEFENDLLLFVVGGGISGEAGGGDFSKFSETRGSW